MVNMPAVVHKAVVVRMAVEPHKAAPGLGEYMAFAVADRAIVEGHNRRAVPEPGIAVLA